MGKRFSLIRARGDRRQVDIANALGRTQGWISDLENGRAAKLTLGDWLRVALVYGVPLSSLVSEESLENFPQARPALDLLGDFPVGGVDSDLLAAGGER